MIQKQVIEQEHRHNELTCIAVDNNEKFCLIGSNFGIVYYIYVESLQIFKKYHDTKEQILNIKISLNDKYIAISRNDNFIYLYKKQDFKGTFVLKKDMKGIINYDFSENAKYLKANYAGEELLYWDVKLGKQLKDGSGIFKDQVWETYNCIFDWGV